MHAKEPAPTANAKVDWRESRLRLVVLLQLLAILLFGVAVRVGTMGGIPALLATVALGGSIAISRKHGPGSSGQALEHRLLFGIGLFGLLGIVGWAPSAIGPTTELIEKLPGAVFLVLAVAAWATRKTDQPGRSIGLLAAALVSVVVLGSLHIESTDGAGFDVFFLHVEAAKAIAEGQNPYTDAVTVPDGSPNAEPGDVVSGYVYPPITAIAYALGHWLTPDARYTSLVAWTIALCILGVSAVRRRSNRDVYLTILLASVPGLWLVLRAAWTEPLSLMFIVIGLVAWARPWASGLGVGAMLASKQYFLVTAPVLLLHRDRGWVRRLLFAGVAVLMTIGPAMLWDAEAFWNSAVAFHASTQPRFDSPNLIGLLSLFEIEWSPPVVVPLVLGLGAAAWAGYGSTSRRTFLNATALALAMSFLVTSQTFANYWFLVFGLCCLGLTELTEEDST